MAGVFCVSVDCHNPDTLSTETARRRNELGGLLQRYAIPSNWTVDASNSAPVPTHASATLALPRSASNGQLVQYLRTARDAAGGQLPSSVVADPHQVRASWSVLVKHEIEVVRTCSTQSARQAAPFAARGGIWVVPLTCSFVGGSRRTVRSLLRVCLQQLQHVADTQSVFHLNVDIGAARNSWPEETVALREMFKFAGDLQQQGELAIMTLEQLPEFLSPGRAQRPQASVLKRAA